MAKKDLRVGTATLAVLAAVSAAAVLALVVVVPAGAHSRGGTGETVPADSTDAPPAGRAAEAAIEWEEVVSSPLARSEAQGAAVGGKLYVFGGYYTGGKILATERSDAYDAATDAWERRADMPEPITHAPAVVADKEIWLIGGFVGDHPGPSTDHVWRYDTRADAWSQGPPLPARRGAGAAAIVGRTIHYFGGVDRTAGQNVYVDEGDHWTLDLDRQGEGWQSRAPLPVPRNHLSGAAVGGKVYAIGGQLGGAEKTANRAEVHRYDPETDAWERLADLPTPRGHTTSMVLDGRVLTIGGTLNGNIPAADVSIYDPATREWAAATPLPAGRKTPVADVVDGRVVSATGNGGGPKPTAWIGSTTGAEPAPPDTTKPVVGRPRPAPGSATRDRALTVRATVRDAGSELAGDDIKLYVDGRARAFSYDPDTDRLSRAAGRLAYGRHFVRVTATDESGNRAARSWSFRVVKDGVPGPSGVTFREEVSGKVAVHLGVTKFSSVG